MKSVTGFGMALFLSITMVGLTLAAGPAVCETDKDIRNLSQHFISPEGMDPWMFVPEDNISEISTSENPGYVTVRQAGKGQDIRGILKDPIRLSDYPLPWQFHMGIHQNYLGIKGLVDEQINWGIGLNLVVTYSDPSTWPADREQRPPDSEEFQLFVVHMGNQGENYRQGLPAVKHTALNQWDWSPEVYLVYGRGDLAPEANGDWKYNYSWVGSRGSLSGTWKRMGGPAEYSIRFNVSVNGSNSLTVGIGSGHDSGWRSHNINTSRPITGIWEIGPIISGDRWIPDVLASELEVNEPPLWIESFRQHHKIIKDISPDQEKILERLQETFEVQPPDKRFESYIDYMVFFGNGHENLDHLSEDFNIPGFLADQKYYIEGQAFGETYSNPGYMTITCYGQNGGWALCPIMAAGKIDVLEDHEPPLEMELAFIPPENDRFWNFWWNVGLYDEAGTSHPWQPCIYNIPGKGVTYHNSGSFDPKRGTYTNPHIEITPTFGPELTQEILTARPLYMLIQIPDQYHMRIAFKGKKEDKWVFSEAFSSEETFGKIAAFAYPALVSFQGGHVGKHGWGTGNYPAYQRFLFDYIYYRYGTLSE